MAKDASKDSGPWPKDWSGQLLNLLKLKKEASDERKIGESR
jgi:hypothetical protein